MPFRITLFLMLLAGEVSSAWAQNALLGKWELDSMYFSNKTKLNNKSSKGYYYFTPKGILKTKVKGLRPMTLFSYCTFEFPESQNDTCKTYIHERVIIKVIPEDEKKEESINSKCGYYIREDTLLLKSDIAKCYYLFSLKDDKLILLNPRKKSPIKLILRRKED